MVREMDLERGPNVTRLPERPAHKESLIYVLTGKPRLMPPWLGSSQRDVTAFPRV